MFVAPNEQNIDGALKMAQSLSNPDLVEKGRKGRELSLVIVPSRIDNGEKELLDAFQEEFEKKLTPFISDKLKFKKSTFVNLMIPYVPFYAYKEKVAVRYSNKASASDLSEAYKNLAVCLPQLTLKEYNIIQEIDSSILEDKQFIEYWINSQPNLYLYRRLEKLLKEHKWLEADQETIKFIYQAVNKQEFCVAFPWDIGKINSHALSSKDFQRLSSSIIYNLWKIDNLWKKYSQGKFGFSAQIRIYREEKEDYYSFCNRVGWRKKNQWVGYNDLIWDLDAPFGHLPWIQGRKMYLTEKAMRNICFDSLSLGFGDNVIQSEDTIISALFQNMTKII